MERVVWILIVFSIAIVVSLVGSIIAFLIRGGTLPKGWSTRNLPKGKGAMTGFWIFAGCGGALLLCIFSGSVFMLILQSLEGPGGPGKDVAAKDVPPPPPKKIGPVPEDLGPKEKQTLIMGGHFDVDFKDQGPDGGLLIGFDIGLGNEFGVELVKSIQPRYRTPQGEVAGRRYGDDFNKLVTVKAKPGYAVGAIDVKAGSMVNGFSTTFMRVKGDRLDPNDSYSSQWVGDKTGGGGPRLLSGDGALIVGIVGKRNTNEWCTGIGLLRK